MVSATRNTSYANQSVSGSLDRPVSNEKPDLNKVQLFERVTNKLYEFIKLQFLFTNLLTFRQLLLFA